jgi:hypothetical protein
MRQSKAEELCAGVHVLHDEAVTLAESVLFMARKLKEAKKTLKKETLVIEYDNGGGQKGIRENPHYVAYERLLASYNKSLRQLTEIIENGSATRTSTGILSELSVFAGSKLG